MLTYVGGSSLSGRLWEVIGPARPSYRRKAHRGREPAIVLVLIAFFVSAALICAALIAPILWTVVKEHALRPRLTYQQCGAVKVEAARLACYDQALRYANDAHPRTVGEILAAQPSASARNDF